MVNLGGFMIMVVEFECRKCGKVVSFEQSNKSKFCTDCGTFLQVKRLKFNKFESQKKTKKIEIKREDINLDSLFFEFKNFSPVYVGDGIVFRSVDAWISTKKGAYENFRKRFSIEKLLDFDYLKRNFKNWLLFRNNLSWTTLQRSGYKALEDPEGLARLITLLQNEDLDIDVRVRRGLKGKEKVNGIGPGILTGLLHTFFNDKYCVWNNRTKDTLEILRYPPTSYRDVGYAYAEVNNKLHTMTTDLKTDLTTIDGFMWFISKYVRFIQ